MYSMESASIKSAPVHIPSLCPYIPGKSENVTTTKRPRFHPSDPCACSSLPSKIIASYGPVVEHWIKTLTFKLRNKKKSERTEPLNARLYLFTACSPNALHTDRNIKLSITLPSIVSRRVISLAKMTMRSDVWHLCITQDEFGVRVSALATKIKDSG